MGGLSEKALQINKISSNTKSQALVLDAGNLLFKNRRNIESDSAEFITAQAIADAYLILGFDAVGIGVQDLWSGIDLLLWSEKRGVPWTSVNLYDSKGDRIFKPYQQKLVDKSTVAIVAITDPAAAKTDEYTIKDPASELAALLPQLEKSFDLIIALSTLPMRKSVELAKQFSEIDIIIGGDGSKGNVTPIQTGKSIVTQTSTRGQYLGVLSVQWRNQPWGKNASAKLAEHKNRLKSITLQLNRLKLSPTSRPKKAETVKTLEDKRKQLQGQIAELQHQIETKTEVEDFSSYSCSFLPLKRSGGSNPQIESIVATVKKKMRDLTNK